jgi:hypothetical protein
LKLKFKTFEKLDMELGLFTKPQIDPIALKETSIRTKKKKKIEN